jgi:Sec7-like guanine-nucleotide exchange factor
MITKFLKRKDLINLQREFLKPFEDIFMSSKFFAVKELMVGSLNYFVSNHHTYLKSGWKTIMSVVSNCFDEDEDPIIK